MKLKKHEIKKFNGIIINPLTTKGEPILESSKKLMDEFKEIKADVDEITKSFSEQKIYNIFQILELTEHLKVINVFPILKTDDNDYVLSSTVYLSAIKEIAETNSNIYYINENTKNLKNDTQFIKAYIEREKIKASKISIH